MTTLFISHSSKDKAWAERMHQALAAGGYQCLFLDSHLDDGIHAGAEWEQALYRRLRQSRAIVVLCSANWLASPWCVAEAMIARDRGKRVFLVASADITDDRQVRAASDAAVPRIPAFLKDVQFVSLGRVTEEEAGRQLLRGLEKEGLKKEDFKLPERPYPGLAPFQETDAAVFFGRDSEIDQVIALLNRRQRRNARGFMLVLGASGCGKSSLVRAGVLPRLRRAGLDRDSPLSWAIVPPVMGGRGLDGLALAVAHAFKEAGAPRDLAVVRGALDAGALNQLAEELLNARGVPEGSLLIVIDQLEEVFGTPEDSEARNALRLLLDASADAGSPLAVLATMRSDFLNAFQLFEGTAERYEKVTLDPMSRSRFAEVIEGPAVRFGIDLDPGLAKRMAEETAYNDALPLLAFTLEKLYETCESGGRLTLQAYGALGGVYASIKHVADAILEEAGYASLPADDLRMRELRRSFYRLAQVGAEGQFTRRLARWSQMPDGCKPLLQRFVDQRLLVSDAANGETVLSVAHEALFRVWDTLNSWLRTHRKALALRAQIEQAAAEWQAENRIESRAWAEERVLDAVREIALSGVPLDDVPDLQTVRAFLGPTTREVLERLPGLSDAEDDAAGSGRYGDAWRLPLSHVARASVGVRLALLGDRREGVGLRANGLPDIDWVGIDGGEPTIEIRSDPNDPSSEVRERLTRTVGRFQIARYPITLVQFRAFLQDCHRADDWQLPEGFPISLPSSYPAPKPRAHYANYPVDSVNWLDASAFCHWLTARLQADIRLPTEFEWQHAATGSDPARIFPWGQEWDPAKQPWRANTLESDLGHATAVGMYPEGAAPKKIQDMAGTLWEWCLNRFEEPDNTEFSTSASVPRVLRGGSWDLPLVNARCAFRDRFNPYDRFNRFGFRVMRSSPL